MLVASIIINLIDTVHVHVRLPLMFLSYIPFSSEALMLSALVRLMKGKLLSVCYCGICACGNTAVKRLNI